MADITKGAKILGIASKEVGYTEIPANTNKTKYGKWFGFDGVAWCGIFVSWCYFMAGFPLPNIGFSKGYAGCQTAVAFFRKKGWIVTDPQEGDIVFFDWNNDGRYDHTGLFKKRLDESHFSTYEGNTSLTNQSNGGQVMERKRTFGAGVVFVRIPNSK
jgi:hypothetical protein